MNGTCRINAVFYVHIYFISDTQKKCITIDGKEENKLDATIMVY